MVTESGQPGSCWLVTGASRGVGFEYIQQLLSNKANRVAAGFRNSSAELEALRKDNPDRLLLVELDVAEEETSQVGFD